MRQTPAGPKPVNPPPADVPRVGSFGIEGIEGPSKNEMLMSLAIDVAVDDPPPNGVGHCLMLGMLSFFCCPNMYYPFYFKVYF